MVTASRRDTFLEVGFGDGVVARYCVKEENGSLIGLEMAPGDDYIYLVENYGEECELALEIEHEYKSEGEYVPSVKGLNANSEIVIDLPTTIVVQNRLQTPSLIHPHAVARDSPVTFTVNFVTRSAHTRFDWTVEVDGGERENFTSVEPFLTYTFTDCGVHQVAVTASNRINAVTVSSSVTVEVPIEGVALTTLSPFVQLGETVVFNATIVAGSDVDFTLDFSDSNGETEVISQNLSSVASHTFPEAGDYSVSVTVRNMLGSVTVHLPELLSVQDPVSGVTLASSAPTLLTAVTMFIATVTQGSHLRFQFRFGSDSDNIVSITNRSVNVTHIFPEADTYEVTVKALNDVSEESCKVTVVVQAAVPPVSVESTLEVVVGENSLFRALLNGECHLEYSFITTLCLWVYGNYTK